MRKVDKFCDHVVGMPKTLKIVQERYGCGASLALIGERCAGLTICRDSEAVVEDNVMTEKSLKS